eukprot:TRINITY_DN12962_c0_g1_i1.p1 TRINITY_DN12962_c0_g1~~TRINITY_DN12962_c0_g1_i1.p1  ORF type:complete len:111 (+),score=6.71 TRINITY_DN12962_c0_g1_i1:123-455(+)
MEFCDRCQNMMYPTEDRETRKLMNFCRQCNDSVDATSNKIYENLIIHNAREKATVLQDVASDTSLPRINGVHCDKCDKEVTAVFCQAATEDMTLYMACTQCNHQWKSINE